MDTQDLGGGIYGLEERYWLMTKKGSNDK